MNRQHYHQHNSTSTSRRGQVASVAPSLAWLSSIVISMTRHLHHDVAKSPRQHHQQYCFQHDSVSTSHCGQVTSEAPLLVWLGSTITSMTQPLHHATTNVASTMSSPVELGSAVVSLIRQHHCQHDSTSTSHKCLITNINNVWLQWQADTLPAHTGPIHHYVWFQGQCKRPDALLGTSGKQSHVWSL
jgi:hypothetical protein